MREALDTTTGRSVALKVLSPFADREQRARFAREVAALRETHDLAAPAFVDAGEDAGRCWLAMEHIDGPTLRAHVEEEGKCATVDVLGLLRGLARGLTALDHAGHLHRDIKPSNVVLRSARLDQPVLVDLGLARGRYDLRLTPAELLVGTPSTAAPRRTDPIDSPPGLAWTRTARRVVWDG